MKNCIKLKPFIEDAAAYEKLGDGLRKFAVEVNKLDKFIIENL